MNWMSDYRENAGGRAAEALRAPIGLMSPLWLVYGMALNAGTTWWWMNRLTRPANLEAMHGGLALEAERLSPAAAPAPIEVDAAEIEIEIESEAAEAVSDAAETVADDLTRMVGIGPRLAELLAERGVVTFAQIAAWTDAEVGEIDTALNLKGRASRDAWIAQARRFVARED